MAKRASRNVTVEDIAEAADVSPRTFFNFPSKEAALFGADPDRAATLRERLVQKAPGAPALEALRIGIDEGPGRRPTNSANWATTRWTGCAG